MVGYLLALATIALFLLLGRELWRPFAARARQAKEREATARTMAVRIEAATASPGASPDRPVEVSSASVVESQATHEPCVMCDAEVIAEDHAVELHEDEPLRVVTVYCRRCGHRRPLYVRIVSEVLH